MLFVGDNNSFMAKAILTGLEDAAYDITTCSFLPGEVEKVKEYPHLCIVCIKELNDNIIRVLNHLLQEKQRWVFELYLIGSSHDLEQLYLTIPKESFSHVLVRPINVDELVAMLEQESEQERLRKILIVDDDTTMLRAMRSLLADDYLPHIVNNGEDALTFLQNIKVDLVLLDFAMPEMSGPEVLERMKRDPKLMHIPVMFLTAKGDKESVLTAAMLKPEKYILKTMPAEEILQTIKNYFKEKEMK
ncbi:Response regulator receiver domain-containing protein [Eubacterium oxidoreducens]|uniref:Stage 0 sporulation protein A homolog n=2 Tax=Eubacterium oxidoreducens TaxID=1732 RepID=A0A1G6A460_EUBOX|nr:Response regulator receiver domain-containing protein [Eubacterium oxidoreducens]